MSLESPFPHCDCFDQYQTRPTSEMSFHQELQDVSCDGWKRMVDLVEQAAADEREEFVPGREFPMAAWKQVVTLPASIAKLKSVRRLVLYHTWIVRLPVEIGDMENLESFQPYWSHRLHWFPYELTRCRRLTDSRVSTRFLYGNFKTRSLFPRLQPPKVSTPDLDLGHLSPGTWGVESVQRCSVCNTSLVDTGLHQAWLSAMVGTDVMPLLVNACSEACIQRLPAGAHGYVKFPHTGGPDVSQPLPHPMYRR